MALALSPLPSFSRQSSALYVSKYDADIDAAVERWWPDFPYPFAWKAQLYQESLLNPDAVSPVGARGLCQAMPATWAQLQRELGWKDVSPHSPKHCIFAGAYYMKKLRKSWSSKRPVWDRQWLAQASYNAGLGNLLAAQKKCGGAVTYDGIIRCLPKITGKHSKETIDYIERIAKWWSMAAPGVEAYRPRIVGEQQ